jgi:ComEC/Rec2-related protein
VRHVPFRPAEVDSRPFEIAEAVGVPAASGAICGIVVGIPHLALSLRICLVVGAIALAMVFIRLRSFCDSGGPGRTTGPARTTLPVDRRTSSAGSVRRGTGRLRRLGKRVGFCFEVPLLCLSVCVFLQAALLGFWRQKVELRALEDSRLRSVGAGYPTVTIYGSVVSEGQSGIGERIVVASVDTVEGNVFRSLTTPPTGVPEVSVWKLHSKERLVVVISSENGVPKLGQRLKATGLLAPSPLTTKAPHLHIAAEMRPRTVEILPGGNPLWRVVSFPRHRVAELAHSRLPQEKAGLLRGLLLGDEAGTPQWVRSRFRDAGLSHLTAVSGQNFAILVAVIQALVRVPGTWPRARTSRGRRREFLGYLCVVLVALAFGAVTGWEPSVMRACAMLLVASSARQLGMPISALAALAYAVFVLVLLDPFVASSAGFQMSVAATAGLLLMAPALSKKLKTVLVPKQFGGAFAPLLARLASVLAVLAAASWSAQIFVAPVTALRFQRFQWAGFVSNLIAVPIAEVASLVGYVSALVGLAVPQLGAWGFSLLGLPLGTLVWIAKLASGLRLPESWLSWSAVGLLVCLGGMLGYNVTRRLCRDPNRAFLRKIAATLGCFVGLKNAECICGKLCSKDMAS